MMVMVMMMVVMMVMMMMMASQAVDLCQARSTCYALQSGFRGAAGLLEQSLACRLMSVSHSPAGYDRVTLAGGNGHI